MQANLILFPAWLATSYRPSCTRGHLPIGAVTDAIWEASCLRVDVDLVCCIVQLYCAVPMTNNFTALMACSLEATYVHPAGLLVCQLCLLCFVLGGEISFVCGREFSTVSLPAKGLASAC